MKRGLTTRRGGLFAALCCAFMAWSMNPDVGHLPKLLTVLEGYGQVVADHGHTHGIIEDFLWAMHGHPHDLADHDHGTELLPSVAAPPPPLTHRRPPPAQPANGVPSPIFRFDRPPRA